MQTAPSNRNREPVTALPTRRLLAAIALAGLAAAGIWAGSVAAHTTSRVMILRMNILSRDRMSVLNVVVSETIPLWIEIRCVFCFSGWLRPP